MPRDIRQKVIVDPGTSAADIGKVETAALEADAALDKLDGSELTVDLDAAMRELEELDATLRALGDRKVEIRAELDARGFSEGVRKIEQDAPGKKIGEQFTRDVGSAFGGSPMTMMAADAVAAFETLGETLGDTVGGRLVGRMSAVLIPALGIGGAVAGIIGGVWQQFTAGARKAAAESAAEVKQMFEAIQKEGATAALRADIIDRFKTLNAQQRGALLGAGLDVEDLSALARGQTVPEFETLRAAATRALTVTGPGGSVNATDFVQRAESILGVSKAQAEELRLQTLRYQEINGLIRDQSSEFTKALTLYRDLLAFAPAAGANVTVVNNYPPSTDGRAIQTGQQEYWRHNGGAQP